MFDLVINFWEWVVSGFCDPERKNDLVAQESSVESGECLIQPSLDTLAKKWKDEVSRTRILRLQRFELQQAHVDFLVSKTKQLPLRSIELAWCSFDLHDGTTDAVLELFQANAATLESIRFWKTKQEDTVPNEILHQLLRCHLPQHMLKIFTLELNYFDFRPRTLNQSLISMLSTKQPHPCIIRNLDLSFCKTNLDFIQRFVSQGLTAHDRLETLSLSGTQMDDTTLRVFVEGLKRTSSKLKRLNLSHNIFTWESLVTLAGLLDQHPSLEMLLLNDNSSLFASGFMQDISGQVSLLVTALCEQSPSLHTLNLAGCSFSNVSRVSSTFFQSISNNGKHTKKLGKKKQTGRLSMRGTLCDLNLSRNPKLMVDSDWVLPLCRCSTLQALTLPGHLRSDEKQYRRLCQLLVRANLSLVDLQFDLNDNHERNPLSMPCSPTLEALLRRNQLLCLARRSSSSLPVSMWPRVVVTLQDGGADGNATNVYAFIQTLFAP